MECEFPSVNSNKEQIKEIFETTKVIAIIGLSPNEEKDSHRVAKYLQEAGFTIVPIYPKEETILGEKVYRSLSEIPFAIDMVNIFRKAKELDSIADVSIARGDVKVFWSQKGIVNNTAAQKAVDAGIKVVQNMCSMVEHRSHYKG
ncbi:MAG: CoA-binding protein [Epsilonproteobacteria bacterium]|nr:CoA-binding protein [Campylobacterota bacterium]OIO13785.1 MAG: CoA-binding protein [Helicobacteraceae bacterium CG1_02_36_14]PIP11196.1 MAG: CoA-binding protein [Sulfurimonas sp. CG23_combo_of_CG06-09_8_20_14_all_36_33]PIS27081.1 MAG: CoA-binding protein [Sulfurimonas sp. CG08_land_8_20_14_0_20_36_33]PIU33687.1 MAG: CoA-binding protein [Sulfurimonas sp. CG07_land_8_20_14_0_80_36_56]PIV05285.1 MAG: CoA-binding protein [Sulfurimonas sp. CG03_land_8_20_14_0_80_36_25]PIV34539.1 MAG: CoA-bindi